MHNSVGQLPIISVDIMNVTGLISSRGKDTTQSWSNNSCWLYWVTTLAHLYGKSENRWSDSSTIV